MKNGEKRRILLEHCDEQFHPYVDKVLQRLTANIVEDRVLDYSGLRIVSFDAKDYLGLFIDFEPHTHCLILLNEVLLGEPEYQIIHTIAHEIAHKVAMNIEEPGALREKEAEDLVVEWGFQKESEAVRCHQPILEGMGFDIGYKWAKNNDLSRFEEFYNEWNEARLTTRRYEELHYQANTSSILHDAGGFEEYDRSETDKTRQRDSLIDDGSLDVGIIAGIMYRLREIKTKTKAAYLGDAHYEFLEQLRRTSIEIGKLFGTRMYSKYHENLPSLGQAYEETDRLLDEVSPGRVIDNC
jgi:hypothetical protein